MVKLDVDPEMVIVPGVWELRVPPERIPPILDPEELSALMVAFEGRPVAVGDEPPEVVVLVAEPDLSGYLIPLDGQLPDSIASMGTKVPSMTDPFKLKNHSIALRVLPSHSKAGVTPEADFSAEVNDDKVWVAVLLGVMPAAASQS